MQTSIYYCDLLPLSCAQVAHILKIRIIGLVPIPILLVDAWLLTKCVTSLTSSSTQANGPWPMMLRFGALTTKTLVLGFKFTIRPLFSQRVCTISKYFCSVNWEYAVSTPSIAQQLVFILVLSKDSCMNPCGLSLHISNRVGDRRHPCFTTLC